MNNGLLIDKWGIWLTTILNEYKENLRSIQAENLLEIKNNYHQKGGWSVVMVKMVLNDGDVGEKGPMSMLPENICMHT
jgi:hypothetical protein